MIFNDVNIKKYINIEPKARRSVKQILKLKYHVNTKCQTMKSQSMSFTVNIQMKKECINLGYCPKNHVRRECKLLFTIVFK